MIGVVAQADLLCQRLAVQQNRKPVGGHQIVDMQLQNDLPDPLRPALDVV